MMSNNVDDRLKKMAKDKALADALGITEDKIREVFLANGFTVKPREGSPDDLRDYVYDAARALIAAVAQPMHYLVLDLRDPNVPVCIYGAPHPSMCHDHIKDAMEEHDIVAEHAKHWVVRPCLWWKP